MASHICDQQRRQVSPQRWAVKLAEGERGRGGRDEEERRERRRALIRRRWREHARRTRWTTRSREKRGEAADRRGSDKQAGTGKNRGTSRLCCAVMGRLTTRRYKKKTEKKTRQTTRKRTPKEVADTKPSARRPHDRNGHFNWSRRNLFPPVMHIEVAQLPSHCCHIRTSA